LSALMGSTRLFDGTFTPQKGNRASRDKSYGARPSTRSHSLEAE
jgi:hypothetical protein